MVPGGLDVTSTATESISSRDIIDDICRKKDIGLYFPDKPSLLEHLHENLKSGDVVVNMGARDPGLGEFARKILPKK